MRELSELLEELGLRPVEARCLAKKLPPPPGTKSYLVSLIQELDRPPMLVVGREEAQRILGVLSERLGLPTPSLPQELNTVSFARLQELIIGMLKQGSGYFQPSNREALYRAVAEEAKCAVADVVLARPLSLRSKAAIESLVQSTGQELVDALLEHKVSFPDFFKFADFLRLYLRIVAENAVLLWSNEERLRRLWGLLRAEAERMLVEGLERLRSKLLLDGLDLAWPEAMMEDLLERLKDLAYERSKWALDTGLSLLQALELLRHELASVLSLELLKVEEEARAAKVLPPMSLSSWVQEKERLLQLIESEVGQTLTALAKAMGKDRNKLLDVLLARVLEAGLTRLGEQAPTLDELRALVRETFARYWPTFANVP